MFHYSTPRASFVLGMAWTCPTQYSKSYSCPHHFDCFCPAAMFMWKPGWCEMFDWDRPPTFNFDYLTRRLTPNQIPHLTTIASHVAWILWCWAGGFGNHTTKWQRLDLKSATYQWQVLSHWHNISITINFSGFSGTLFLYLSYTLYNVIVDGEIPKLVAIVSCS